MKTLKRHQSFWLSFLIFTAVFTLSCILFIYISSILTEKQDTHRVSIWQDAAPIVIIDAGHGGEDGGAIGLNGVFEKDINLSIARKIEAILREE